MNLNIKTDNRQSGIYKITNEVDGKSYIGQSIDIYGRRRSHLSHLRNGKHQNSYLQNAWNKYGEESFSFRLLTKCDKENLDERETFYIDDLKTTDREKGYNLRTGGMGNWNVSEETGNRISETKIKNKLHRGESNANALFSNEVAEKIIKDLLKGVSRERIMDKYSVPMSSVRGIIGNRTYIDIMPEVRHVLKGETDKLYLERMDRAVKMYLGGLSQSAISKKINMSRRVLSRELTNRGIDTKNHKNQNPKGGTHPTAKRVVQMTKEGKLIKEFLYVKKASEETGVGHSNITRVCRKEGLTAGGYKWMYLKDYKVIV